MGSDAWGRPFCRCWQISIHAPRMGSDFQIPSILCSFSKISIHAPRMGSDHRLVPFKVGVLVFLSTPPAWGATAPTRGRASGHFISIHAPRMGSDAIRMGYQNQDDISIHAPRMGSDRIA